MRNRLARFVLALATVWCAWAVSGSTDAHAGCKDFEGAKQADIKDAKVNAAITVWRGVFSPFHGLTGRDTGLVVLHQDAVKVKKDGSRHPFKPTAHICPGAPPVVYVTWPLIELVYGAGPDRYPEAFLAFVIAHELGHRMNDLNAEGSLLGKAERASAGTGFGVEEMADKRAAFLAAAAGYSMRTLAREEIVKSFLSTELGLRSFTVESRDQILISTLNSFDAYENLYDVAVAMTMSGEREVAIRLLARADELIQGEGVPLPEVKVLRAIALMNAAAPHAPWRQGLSGLTGAPLRCAPVYATHTALWEEGEEGAVRSGVDLSVLQEKAAARLILARSLLVEAEKYGISPLISHSVTGCISLYEGDVKAATTSFDKAKEAAGKKPPEALSSAFAQNLAMARFVAFVVKNPAPVASDRKKAKAWGKSVGKLSKKTKANREVVGVIARLKKYPSLPMDAPMTPTPGETCGGDAAPIPAPAVPDPIPAVRGKCPDGFKFSHSLPPMGKGEGAMGVTTCQREVEGQPHATDRYVRLRLPGAMEPELEPIDLVVVIREFARGKRPTRRALTCDCPNVMVEGVSDVGERAEVVICPARGMITGVIMSDASEEVTRVIVYEEVRGE